MKVDKTILKGLVIGLVAIYIWRNRGSFLPKEPLNVNPNDGKEAIKQALRDIKMGVVEVKKMPENIREELINAK